MPIFTRVNQVKRRVIKIGLRELDAAVMIGYLFLNEIDDLIGLDDDDQRYKMDIQTEYFHNIIQTYGFERAATQLADILGLIVDINVSVAIFTPYNFKNYSYLSTYYGI